MGPKDHGMTTHNHPEPVDGCWQCATTLEPGEHEETWHCIACGHVTTHRCGPSDGPRPLHGPGSTPQGRAAARAAYEAARRERAAYAAGRAAGANPQERQP